MEIGKEFIGLVACSLVFLVAFPAVSMAVFSYDVIVVRGDVPTDYIIGSIYAGKEKIPLVLVDPDTIQDQIKSELRGYRNGDYQMLLIIGGEKAITKEVENELKGMGFFVNRLWDWNRYGTAARVSIDLWGESEEVVVANGEDYAGFLLAQKAALEKGIPILFMTNETVPEETLEALRKLGTKSVILVGGGEGPSGELRSMSLEVKSIETVSGKAEEVVEKPADPYLITSAVIAAVFAAVILARLWKGRKASLFVMTEDEEKIVEILKTHGKTGQNKLAEMTGFSKPRISRMIRSLEERGIVDRKRFKKTYKIKLSPNIA